MALPSRQEPRVRVMSKLKELVNRGVRLIVTQTPGGAPAAAASAERELPPDAFEAAKQREVQELRADSERRIQAIKDEIEAFLKAKNGELESLKRAAEAAGEAFVKLQAKKRREEERLFDVVAHFVAGAENPITKSAGGPAPSPPPPKPDQA